MSSALTVLGASALAVLASACGVAPLALRRTWERVWIGLGSGIAAGVMLAVGAGLLLEGESRNPGLAAAGAVAGVGFVVVLRRALGGTGDLDVADLAGAEGRRAVLIVAVLTLHSAAEGLGLGSSFAGSGVFGLAIAIALAVHKIPEGFAVGLVLVPRGVSLRAATAFGALAAVPLLLLAVPGFLFVHAFRGALPVALGFAAGAMVVVALTEMLPEAIRLAPRGRVLMYGGAALVAVAAFEAMVSSLG